MPDPRLPRIYVAGSLTARTDVPLTPAKQKPSDANNNALLVDEVMLAENENYTIEAEDASGDEVTLPTHKIIVSMGMIAFDADLPSDATTFKISGNLHARSEVGFAQSYTITRTNNLADYTTTKSLLDNGNCTSNQIVSKQSTIELNGILEGTDDIKASLDNPVMIEFDGIGSRRFRAQGRASADNDGGGISGIQTLSLTIQSEGRFGVVSV